MWKFWNTKCGNQRYTDYFPILILVNSDIEVKFEIPIAKDKDIEKLKEELFILDDQEDVGGIYIDTLHEANTVIKKHFSNEFIYTVTPTFGNFIYDENLKNVYDGNYDSIIDEYFKNRLDDEDFLISE
jgi:hypothetical protein